MDGRDHVQIRWKESVRGSKAPPRADGKKKQPTYRVVAADSRSPRDGRFLEIVGTYAPRGTSTAEPDAVIQIDNAKAVKWLANGPSRPSGSRSCCKTSGAWDEFAAARAK